MKVFSDLHHAGLFFSLKLLFEERIGGEIFRPIGERWFQEGFWDIAKPYSNNPETVKQYLQIKPEYIPKDGTPSLNKVISSTPTHYEVEDVFHNYVQKCLTFEQFLALDIDIIIASIPDHWITYKKLRDKYKPKAKLICQMGNMFSEVSRMLEDGVIQNLMASTIEFPVPETINKVFYHQEQPLRAFTPPPQEESIKSFVHYLPNPEVFSSFKKSLFRINFKSYGAGCEDGWCSLLQQLYDEIQNSSFVFGVKKNGDGYGWNFHSAYMLGRPIITDFNDYKDKLGGKLFKDLENGIDLSARSHSESVILISEILSDKDRHLNMCKNAYNSFRKVVDYDKEYMDIKKFLERLI